MKFYKQKFTSGDPSIGIKSPTKSPKKSFETVQEKGNEKCSKKEKNTQKPASGSKGVSKGESTPSVNSNVDDDPTNQKSQELTANTPKEQNNNILTEGTETSSPQQQTSQQEGANVPIEEQNVAVSNISKQTESIVKAVGWTSEVIKESITRSYQKVENIVATTITTRDEEAAAKNDEERSPTTIVPTSVSSHDPLLKIPTQESRDEPDLKDSNTKSVASDTDDEGSLDSSTKSSESKKKKKKKKKKMKHKALKIFSSPKRVSTKDAQTQTEQTDFDLLDSKKDKAQPSNTTNDNIHVLLVSKKETTHEDHHEKHIPPATRTQSLPDTLLTSCSKESVSSNVTSTIPATNSLEVSQSLPSSLPGSFEVVATKDSNDDNKNMTLKKKKKDKKNSANRLPERPHTKTSESLVERVLRIGTLPEKFAASNEREGSALRLLLNELYRQGMDALQVEDILELIRWTTNYQEETSTAVNRHHGARSFDSDSIEQMDESEALLKGLLKEYQLRVKRQVRKWLSVTSFEQDVGVIQNNEGHLITGDPEDILYVMNAELEVALEYLPPQNVVDLMVIMFRELELMQARIQYIIDTDGLSVDLTRLCAVVNDSCRMSERCTNMELLDGGLTGKEGFLPTFELKKKATEVEKGYLELALHSSYAIVGHMFSDIDPLLAKVFTNEWELGDLVPTSLATFQDYFLDLEEWIQPLFYGKLVRRTLDDFLQHYWEAFFAPHKRIKVTLDVVCGMLEKDRLYALEFFGSEHILSRLRPNGLRDVNAIADRLQIFQAIANIFREDDPNIVKKDIEVILRDFGNQAGTVAIMYIVQIRKSGTKHQSVHETIVDRWRAAVTSATKAHPHGDLRRRIPCDFKHLIRPYHRQVLNKMNPFSEDLDFITNITLMPHKHKHPHEHNNNHGKDQEDNQQQEVGKYSPHLHVLMLQQIKSNIHKMTVKSSNNFLSSMDKAKLRVESSVRKAQQKVNFTKESYVGDNNRPPSPVIRARYESDKEQSSRKLGSSKENL